MKDLRSALTEVQVAHLPEAWLAVQAGIAPSGGWWFPSDHRREGRSRVQAVAAVELAVLEPGRMVVLVDHAAECNPIVTRWALVAEVGKLLAYAGAGGSFELGHLRFIEGSRRAPRGAHGLVWRPSFVRRVTDALAAMVPG